MSARLVFLSRMLGDLEKGKVGANAFEVCHICRTGFCKWEETCDDPPNVESPCIKYFDDMRPVHYWERVKEHLKDEIAKEAK